MTFELRQLTLPRGGFRDVTATAQTGRTALLGHWEPFFQYLLGTLPLEAGEALVQGQPAREQVTSGQVGLVHADLVPGENESVLSWLQESLRLCGETRSSAKARALEVLRQLEVSALGVRKGSTLGPLELVAVQYAHAMSTRPHTLFIQPTVFAPEHLVYERTLAERSGARIVVALQLPRHLEWLIWCQESLWAPGLVPHQGAPLTALNTQFSAPSLWYLMTPLAERTALEAALGTKGIRVENPGQQDLIVQLMEGQAPTELMLAAAEAGAPLARMIPLG